MRSTLHEMLYSSQSKKNEEKKELKVNIQGEKSGKNTILLKAYLNFGYKRQVPELTDWVTLRNSTGEHKYLWRELDWQHREMIMEEWQSKCKPCVVNLGITLPLENWDKNKKQAIGTFTKVNEELNNFRISVKHLYELLINQYGDELTPEILKKNVESKITDVQVKEIPILTITQLEEKREEKIYTPRFIDYCTKRNDLEIAAKDIGIGAWKHNRVVINHWKKFEEERIKRINEENGKNKDKKRGEIFCQDLSTAIYEEFFIWLRKLPSIKKESTIDKDKSTVKHFSMMAKEDHHLDKLTVSINRGLRKKAGGKEHRKPIIYLTVPELNQLEALTKQDFADLDAVNQNNKSRTRLSHELIRDYFLVQSWNGGLRFQDYYKFTLIERVDKLGKYYVDNISLKTNTYSKLPTFQIVVEIFKKYKNRKKKNEKDIGSLPPPPSNQAFNRGLKAICKKAKINELILIDNKGTRTEKWNIVSSHMAIKNYVNNMIYDFGANRQNVAIWCGKTVQIMEKYYLGEDLRNAFRDFDDVIDQYENKKSKS
jgi:hypothetical protein